MSVVEDRPGSDPTEMDETEGDAALPQTDPTPPEADPAGATDAPGPAEAVPAAPELPPKFMPPTGGNPFSFRVDRTEVAVPGARVIDGHLVMPREAWDQHIQSKWVANRAEWTKREQQYQTDLRTLQQQTIPEERQKAQAMLGQLGDMLDGTPAGRDKLIAWLDNYEQNAPLLKQQAETRILQEKLARYEREQAESTVDREAEELRPRLEAAQAEYVADAIKRFPELRGQKDLAERIWKFHAATLWDEPTPKQYRFNHDRLNDIVEDEARRMQAFQQQTAKAADVAKKNAAAVGPPRTPTGQFVKPPPPPGAARRPLTAREWDERYADKKFS